MYFNEVRFEFAAGKPDQLPKSNMPEIVFSGHSNVGKSSLINKLVQRKSLARVSAQPGKTATIKREKKLINVSGFHTGIFTDANFNTTAYNVNDQFYIIQLWGAWRYYDKNGFEIETDFKFKTLTDAKKYAGIYAEKLAS